MAAQALLGATAIWFGGRDNIPCLRDGIFVRAMRAVSRPLTQAVNSTAKYCTNNLS